MGRPLDRRRRHSLAGNISMRRNPNVCPICHWNEPAHDPSCQRFQRLSYVGSKSLVGQYYPQEAQVQTSSQQQPIAGPLVDQYALLFTAAIPQAACDRVAEVYGSDPKTRGNRAYYAKAWLTHRDVLFESFYIEDPSSGGSHYTREEYESDEIFTDEAWVEKLCKEEVKYVRVTPRDVWKAAIRLGSDSGVIPPDFQFNPYQPPLELVEGTKLAGYDPESPSGHSKGTLIVVPDVNVIWGYYVQK